jgi:sec-independent protein translocase protein TatC
MGPGYNPQTVHSFNNRDIMAESKTPGAEMPFLDHLEELRWRIIKSIGALGIGSALGFFLVHYFEVTELLVRPVRPYLATGALGDPQGIALGLEGKLLALNPATPFFLELKLALLTGLILSFPILVYQVWAFLSPALEQREKKVIVPSLYLGLVLFSAGVLLAYLLALPLTLRFLYGFQTDYVAFALEANEYLSFVVRLLLIFGIVFELPVVVIALSVFGLITPKFLRSKRRHAVVAITVLGSFLTPGDMVMVTLLMMVPFLFLFELSIVLSALIERRREEWKETSPDGPTSGAIGLWAGMLLISGRMRDKGRVQPFPSHG